MKLVALALFLSGSLAVASGAQAQEEPEAGDTGATGVTAVPADQPASRSSGGGIKDNGPHQRPQTASALLYTPWRFGFGFGLKLGYEIPIVHNGFIPSINNSFSIEPNFAFAWSNYNRGYGGWLLSDEYDWDAIEFTPGVSALWSFHFSPQFRAYAAVHLGVTIVKPYYSGPGESGFELKTKGYFHGELAPGIVYSLNDKIALRAELGWWSGIKFGVTVLL